MYSKLGKEVIVSSLAVLMFPAEALAWSVESGWMEVVTSDFIGVVAAISILLSLWVFNRLSARAAKKSEKKRDTARLHRIRKGTRQMENLFNRASNALEIAIAENTAAGLELTRRYSAMYSWCLIDVRRLRDKRPGGWETFILRFGISLKASEERRVHAQYLDLGDEYKQVWRPMDDDVVDGIIRDLVELILRQPRA